ncbi:MAG: hypothetical protein ACI8S6_001878 [Myxococcota bacterium]|jgi:hypothetical protein
MMVGRAVIILLLGCGRSEERSGAAELYSQWGSSPERLAVALSEREPAEARLVLLTDLLLTHPELSAAGLCAHLPAGPERAHCSRISARPHLWSAAQEAPASGRTHPLPQTLPSRLADTPPLAAEGCSGDRPVECASRQAAEAAGSGAVSQAAGLCRGLQGQRWAEECMFRAAERAVSGPAGLTRYADGVSLCALSGDFAGDCLAHLQAPALRAVPASTAPATAWRAVRRDAERIQGYWASIDPDFSAETLDRLWAAALLRAYSGAAQVTGDPLDALPSQAVPQVRAAAALQLMSSTTEGGAGLQEWKTRLRAALEARSGTDGGARARQGQEARLPDFWPPGSSAPHGEIAYPGRSRRAHSDDPDLDLLVVLLEAAARTPGPERQALLREGAAHPDPVVRWTATRLVERLQAGDP